MILTPAEQERRAALIAEIADMAAALSERRKAKRQLELMGWQRAHRAKKKGEAE